MYDQFANYYDLIFPFRDATYQFLKGWLKNGKNRILDLGCGTGNYLSRFAQEGHQVVGIDLNETMLAIAQKKCPRGRWLALDLKNLADLPKYLPDEREAVFDLVFCTGNVLSYLSLKELKQTLINVYNLLNPGGHWIFQIVNWQKILKQDSFVFPVIENREQGIRFLRAYQNITAAGALFETRLEKDGEIIFEDQQRLFAHKQNDFVALCSHAKFNQVEFFGDFKKTAFSSEKSGALIGVCKKEH